MKFTILMGSPRKNGNTAELCKPFIEELEQNGAEIRYIPLADKDIKPCLGCYACQNVQGEYGCVQEDDMNELAKDILWADCIVFATPIYAWYCAAKMKSLLDRHYGFNKYYGSAQGCLWEGKKTALILTHGYERDYATEPFVMGFMRLSKHCNLEYCGMYSVQDEDDLASFQTEEAKKGAREFAKALLN